MESEKFKVLMCVPCIQKFFPSLRLTEIYDPLRDSFSFGPDLPEDAYSACAAEVEDGRVFVSGGEGVRSINYCIIINIYLREKDLFSFTSISQTSNSAFIIDVDSGDVEALPPTPVERDRHACGVVESQSFGGLDIVVVGGR